MQRADAVGRAHVWGGLGICEEAALAAHGVIYTAEEIVPAEVILSDPNRVLAPASKTLAVVHAPGGAHPSPVQGYYNRDHAAFAEYHERSRTARLRRLATKTGARRARPRRLSRAAGRRTLAVAGVRARSGRAGGLRRTEGECMFSLRARAVAI